MRGDMEALYDSHSHRLYAHCWSLLGDQGAANAVRDAFGEAVRYPPRGDTVLWLHRLARFVCTERGAFGKRARPVFVDGDTDPLLRAAAEMRADHREALLLSAGEWLEVRDIARVLRVAPGLVHELLHEARTSLERRVLDALMRGGADPARHHDVIAAFEKGRLANLLARRAPALAPKGLRDYVLSTIAHDDDDRQERHTAAPLGAGRPPVRPTEEVHAGGNPLVVIGSAPDDVLDSGDDDRGRRRRAALKGAGAVAGVAASVAAGLVMTWPSPDGGSVNAAAPNTGTGQPGVTNSPSSSPSASETGPAAGAPQRTGGTGAAPAPTPTTQEQEPVAPASPADSPRDGSDGSRQEPSDRSGSSDDGAPPAGQEPAPEEQQEEPRRPTPIRDTVDGVGGLVGGVVDGLLGGGSR